MEKSTTLSSMVCFSCNNDLIWSISSDPLEEEEEEDDDDDDERVVVVVVVIDDDVEKKHGQSFLRAINSSGREEGSVMANLTTSTNNARFFSDITSNGPDIPSSVPPATTGVVTVGVQVAVVVVVVVVVVDGAI